MSKTVRLEDSTWSELEKRGVALAAGRGSAIGITPDAIIRYIREIDDSSTSKPIGADSSLSVTQLTRPHSSVQSVQQLLDGIWNGVGAILGPVTLAPTQSGRWISQPSNFFTVKSQDARNRDVAVTVYGESQDAALLEGWGSFVSRVVLESCDEIEENKGSGTVQPDYDGSEHYGNGYSAT